MYYEQQRATIVGSLLEPVTEGWIVKCEFLVVECGTRVLVKEAVALHFAAH